MTSARKRAGLALAVAATLAAVTPAAALAQYDGRYYDQDQARRDYDAQYGRGAYDRYYSDHDRARRNYDSEHDRARRDYDARYGEGAYDRYYGAQAAQTYREDPYRADRRACREHRNGNAVAGGLLGGIAGAVIGSNVARGGGRTGGAIIGGVGGAALGSSIAKNSTHCDQ